MAFGTLTIVMPDGRSRSVVIDRPQLRIGRNPDNDVVIDDPSVSGYHARIFAGPNGLRVLDVGSRNGTEVDGSPITTWTPISSASRVRVGTATLSVALPGAAAPADDFVLPPFPDPVPATTGPAPIAAVAGAAGAAATAPARSEGPPLARLDLQPPTAKADISAGGPAVLTFVATAQNLSRFVDRLDLAIDGPPWLSAVVDPPFHNLKPGDTAQSRVELSVPRDHSAAAGEHPIELVARSQKRPELRFAAAAQLIVTPFTDFRFELLEPRHATAWTGGRYRAQATNKSNRPVVYNFEGLDTDGALIFSFDPDPVELKPGERRETAVRARFKFFRLFGRAKTYDFQLTCEPIDQSSTLQQAQGRLIQRPPLPPWMLISGAVAALLALLLACTSAAYNASVRWRLFDQAMALLFPSAVVTPTITTTPLIDITATLAAAAGEQETALAEVGATGTAAASAVAGANTGTQTAQTGAFAATQAAVQTAGATALTAVAGSAGGTATAQVGTAAAGNTAAALTTTAQGNATGTAIAGTLTAIARTTTTTPGTPTPTPTGVTPTATLPGVLAGQTITFERLRGLSVNQRIPIRGDEYAGQDAFFCFYSPRRSEGSLGRRLAAGSGKPLFAVARQPGALTVAIQDVSLPEGSSGGTTNFVFNITATSPTTSTFERVFVLEYRTADGAPGLAAATSPSDYLPLSGNFTLRIPAGGTGAQATVTIAVNADFETEATEGFTVSLSSPEGVPLLGRTQAFGIINNDDQPSPTPTSTATPTATPTPTLTPTPDPFPDPPPSGDVFNCQPPVPSGTVLISLRGVILPPPVVAANNGPLHSLTTDTDDGRLIPNSIAVVNFQRNVAEVNVDIWYPGGEAAAYVMFAFDERGALIATARRDAIGVPAAYQLNIRSLERPVRQLVIEARREFSGDFGGDYRFAPVVPPLLTRVDFRYTTP